MIRLSTVLGCCLLLLSTSVHAQQPSHESRTLSFQGMISSTDYSPMNGEREITIRFYSDADGHNLVWQDTYSTVVANGVFNLALGSGSQLLPASDVMSRPIWVGTQIGTADEMRPLATLSASPFALAIADNSVTKEKIATDYVSSLSLNGQRVSGRGADINVVTGDGIDATLDPSTNSLLLKAGATSLDGAKGGGVQGNTTIYGNETVTGVSYLGSSGSGVYVYSLGASQPVKSNSGKMLVSGAIDLTNVSETDVSGALTGTNGGTGHNNGTNTITLGGNLTTTPSNNVTFTTTGATNVTLPTTGTLVTTDHAVLFDVSTTQTSTTAANNLFDVTSAPPGAGDALGAKITSTAHAGDGGNATGLTIAATADGLVKGINITTLTSSGATSDAINVTADATTIDRIISMNGTTSVLSIKGTGNLALGQASGGDFTGEHNTVIGAYTGMGLTGIISANNTLVGCASGNSLTTSATNNTIVGAASGGGVSSVGNTIVGANSAAGLSIGVSNTVLGSSAGSGLGTGNYNVLLGGGADVFGSGIAHSIALGASAVVTISNAANINTNLLGLNVTAPSSTISFDGTADRTIRPERNTDDNTTGHALTIQAGAPIVANGTNNEAGGNLVLSSGTTEGTSASNVIFNTASGSSGNNADHAPAEVARLTGAGNLLVGNTDGTNMVSVGIGSPFTVSSTGTTTVTKNGVGTGTTDGIILLNTTAAGANGGAPFFIPHGQNSPLLRLTGEGWKTDAVAGSEPVDWIIENQPFQGTSAPTTMLVFSSKINNLGSYLPAVLMKSSGDVEVTGTLKGDGGLDANNSFITNAGPITGATDITSKAGARTWSIAQPGAGANGSNLTIAAGAGNGNAQTGGNLLLAAGAGSNVASITGTAWGAGTATITATNTFSVGQVVTITGVNPVAYNGTWVITAQSGTNFAYAITPDPTAWVSGGTGTVDYSGSVRIGNALSGAGLNKFAEQHTVSAAAGDVIAGNTVTIINAAIAGSSSVVVATLVSSAAGYVQYVTAAAGSLTITTSTAPVDGNVINYIVVNP